MHPAHAVDPAPVSAIGSDWAINQLIEPLWRDWGGDSVVLEACSGQLFQFDALAAAAMACFESGTTRLDEVVDALARDLCITADGEFVDTVRCLVQEFHRLGWLEPIIR